MAENRNDLQEKYEDALFALIMDKYLQQLGHQALAENERIKASDDYAPSQLFDHRIEKLIQNEFHSMKRKQRNITMRVVVKRIGLALCAALLLAMTVFAAFPEVKNSAMNLWLDITDEYAVFRFLNESSAETATTESAVPDDFVITWLPDSFEQESTLIMPSSAHYKYAAPGNKSVHISKYIGDGGTLSIDTEDAEVKHMQFHGMEALLTQKECLTGTGETQNEITLTWWDVEETMIMRIVAVEISESEVMQIAEGIQEKFLKN